MPREEVRIGVTWSDSGWCWLDSRIIYVAPRVWIREVNETGGMFVPGEGRRLPVRLIRYDDRSSPELEAALVERMIVEDGIDVFCSSPSAEMQREALAVTERHGILNLNIGAPDHQLFELGYRYHLQCGPSLRDRLRSRPAFWRNYGLTRVAQLYADFWGWNGIAAPVAGYVEDVGGLDLVLREAVPRSGRWSTEYGPYPAGYEGWPAVVERLRAARPDAVLVSLPAPAEYRIMREMRRQRVWFPYLEMMYGPRLSKVGFGLEDLLYQFHGVAQDAGVDAARIDVGGTQDQLDANARRYFPGVDGRVWPTGYVGLSLWAHLVERAGSMEAEAVVEQALSSPPLTTMAGTVRWLANGDTAPIGDAPGIAQLQRHLWSGDLQSVVVHPPEDATGTPVLTDQPYEDRSPPWAHETARPGIL